MVIVAVDLGRVRTGVAICDENEVLASPLTVLRQPNREKLAEEIAALAQERRARALVLGHPVNMDGSEGDSAKGAQEFAVRLREATGLPVTLRDERGTTITAHRYLNETDTRGKKRKAVVDAVAAVIILQDYLEYRRLGGKTTLDAAHGTQQNTVCPAKHDAEQPAQHDVEQLAQHDVEQPAKQPVEQPAKQPVEQGGEEH